MVDAVGVRVVVEEYAGDDLHKGCEFEKMKDGRAYMVHAKEFC